MIKNIIFDWSGTLSDDWDSGHTAAMRVFKKLGLKVLSSEEHKKEFILPYMNFYKKYKKDIGKKEIDRLFFKEINLVNEPKPFPKAEKILNFFKTKGIKMALLSSHPQKKLEKELRNYGFQKFFIEVKGSVHDKREVIYGIMKRNRFNNKETAYVGDMVHDIDAGKEAKVTAIAVSWGYQSREKLSKENPDFIIDDLDELKHIIRIK
ncbi:MAG: HAD family hydrolase [Candidatus Woesearchaeota archaeon]|nr:HAD family hydrolase [Candidatus Woesearchaeota archaeon]